MRKKTQRRLITLLVIAVIGLGVVVAVGSPDTGCQGNEGRADTPEAVVESAIRALESRNIANVLQYFTPPAANIMYDRLYRLYSRCNSIEVGSLTTLLTADGELTARVRVVYDLNLAVGQQTSNEDYDKRIKLINNKGTWYINEAF